SSCANPSTPDPDPLPLHDALPISPIDQMVCRIQFHQAAYDGYFTPPTADRYWIQYPGYNGGSDWGGVAVDPARGVIVANYNDMRSEEHTSELQSRENLVCRLLLEK